MLITKLDQIVERVKSLPNKRLIAAYAVDTHTIEAINEAVKFNLVDATLVGDEALINASCKELNIDPKQFEIIHQPNDMAAATLAVDLINKGKGELLMKGLVSTDKYMRAILNKENGLLPPKGVLTHVTVIENPSYHKLLIVGDVAIIPQPDFSQKVAITNFLIQTAHKLGIEMPKVALIAAAEQITMGMTASYEAAIISKMIDRGQIKGAYIDGPLGLDLAIDKESAEIKGVGGPVVGDADCLLFPNIESGNVFYKTSTKLCNSELAAMVFGAKVPCILSSRGDSAKTKLYSIALSSLMA